MRFGRKLVPIGKQRFRTFVRSVAGYPTIDNATGVRDPGGRRRALLVYLVDSFLMRDADPRFLGHQNLRQCRQIAAALDDAGYSVDVADVHDTRFRPARSYDLVVSHRVDLEDPEGFLKNALRVYLATGMNHADHNRNMRARYEALAARRTCALAFQNPNTEEVPFVRAADAIAGFGNARTAGSWRTVAPVPFFPFNNYGYKATRVTTGLKNFAEARKNFLFFASRDQVGKGLDLLLEIFPKHPELQLYVCSAFRREEEFTRCYERELYRTTTIHPIGLIGVNSSEFDELTQKCAHVILPSCSEGQPGSVVQCMHGGLVPLVTRECGMDLGGLGTILPNAAMSTIEEAVVAVSSRPEEWHRDQAQKIVNLALEEFSEDAFAERWKAIAHECAGMRHGEPNR